MEHKVYLNTSNIVGRQELVRFLYSTFANEEAGTPEDVSRYSYYVETLEDNTHIYLRRPAPRNNGIDFTVKSDGYRFPVGKRRMHNPSHDNIFSMLQSKRVDNMLQYDNQVKPLIARIYNVEPLMEHDYRILGFSDEAYSIELILKLLKWLFAEQDATYWNHSGRNMLFRWLQQGGLA
jgi:hypothetical protein